MNKGIWGSKQFAFKNFLTCGQCGGAIVAQEKFKKLRNGDINHHIYYCCNRRVDPSCQEPYINEPNLRILLKEFIEANYKKIKVNDKLRARLNRYYDSAQSLMSHYGMTYELSDPLVEYTRFILNKGTGVEQAALVSGMVSKLKIEKGNLYLC